MSGIVFLGTQNMQALKQFYLQQVSCDLWLEQEDCVIFRHGNMLIGFCERAEVERSGVITFFYLTRDKVDDMYGCMENLALREPTFNEKYGIYHFFAHDPEDRIVEFQCFDEEPGPFMAGDEMLLTRRSIREYLDLEVPQETLDRVFELCRHAPTACNSQPYYYVEIRDRATLERLSQFRGSSTAPIGKAPMAIAICSDPGASGRHVQDGCIGCYHFILASWLHGLGTCWMGGMDHDDVKDAIGVPREHYCVTVTPLGYPAVLPNAPGRKPLSEFVKR